MIDWICWVFSIVNVIGTLLNIRKMYLCFFIWSVCNVFWLYLDIVTGQYARIILDVINLATSLYGAYSWYKDSKKSRIKADYSREIDEGDDNMSDIYKELNIIESYSYFLEKDIDSCINNFNHQEYNEAVGDLVMIKEHSSKLRKRARESLKRLMDSCKEDF